MWLRLGQSYLRYQVKPSPGATHRNNVTTEWAISTQPLPWQISAREGDECVALLEIAEARNRLVLPAIEAL